MSDPDRVTDFPNFRKNPDTIKYQQEYEENEAVSACRIETALFLTFFFYAASSKTGRARRRWHPGQRLVPVQESTHVLGDHQREGRTGATKCRGTQAEA